MKPLYLIAASTLALTTAACGNGPPKARAALDCPVTQGDLTRTSASPDGKVCTYVSSEGAEVTLQLVSVQGGPDATLRTIETNLVGLQEAALKAEEARDPKAKDSDKADAKATAEASAEAGPAADEVKTARSAADAAREAAADAAASPGDKHELAEAKSDKGSRVTVARGAVIVDEDEGTTHVNLPGIHIEADDTNDTANVDIGPLHVNAGGDGATIRIRRDVRLRGEQLSREKRGLRATFISEKESLQDGYRFVAYEAGGPKAGPITVAIVRAKADISQGDDVYKAVRRLVRANGGV